jgi:hypothetical protein
MLASRKAQRASYLYLPRGNDAAQAWGMGRHRTAPRSADAFVVPLLTFAVTPTAWRGVEFPFSASAARGGRNPSWAVVTGP